jgi:hypothetical protein
MNRLSGNHARIAKITERLNSIQTSLDSDRYTRTEDFDRKLKDLEETMWTTQEQTGRKFTGIKEALSRLTQSQEEERQAHDALVDDMSRDFVAMEETSAELLRKAAGSRREFEAKVSKAIEERTLNIAQEVTREVKSTTESCEQQNLSIDQELPTLEAHFKQLQSDRTPHAKQVEELIADETNRLREEVSREENAREESENALLSLMREVTERIRSELVNEKSEREAAEETLLSLLEETCTKIKALS